MDEAICVRVCLCVTLILYLGQNNYPKCRTHCVQLGDTCNICSTFLGHQIQNGSEHIRLQALLESWSGQVIDYFSYDTAKRADERTRLVALPHANKKAIRRVLDQLCQLQQ